MVTFVFSAEPLFSLQNHCYQCGIIVFGQGGGGGGGSHATSFGRHEVMNLNGARDREPVQSCSPHGES